ncbi:hypothetical protein CONLIGDRAFT_416757 [Coniochaeta ligniaria NRRL 30616]|uniref:Uncharacterized protein n=1 Tax=Coniochaeta ligniaria NRRL 30616 TaxID=1408157 RepID=A0A1J7JD56_9PEZI|nr:hypothetical protein CONLIGDRAFT_416757 [Coniochaeta ligniaria NRRL 30616]
MTGALMIWNARHSGQIKEVLGLGKASNPDVLVRYVFSYPRVLESSRALSMKPTDVLFPGSSHLAMSLAKRYAEAVTILYLLLSPSLRSMSVVYRSIWRIEVLRHSPRVIKHLLSLALPLLFWGFFIFLAQIAFFNVASIRSIDLSYLQRRLFLFTTSYDDALADIHSYNKTWLRPDLHVLVDARVRDLGLCKTLLSTVVQGYPAPILVGYHSEPGRMGTLDLFRSIRDTIVKPPTAKEDIILWLGRNHWVQLPVEVTVRRFLQLADVMASTTETGQRSKSREVSDTSDRPRGNNAGQQLVLLPASKACVYDCENTDILPESTLPKDLYGPLTDKVPCPSLKRPRFAAPDAFIGTARDITDSVTDMIDHIANSNTSTLPDEQSAWSHLFHQQELQRSIEQQNSPERGWIHKAFASLTRHHTKQKPQTHKGTKISSTATTAAPAQNNTNHDHGLTLDYASHIFQTLHHSTQDIRFLTFSRPLLINSPSRTAAHLFHLPLRLPPELEHASLPLLRANNISWRTAPLVTNIAVPLSSIPAILNLHDTQPHLADVWWREMWFFPYARELVGMYTRPDRGSARVLMMEVGCIYRGCRLSNALKWDGVALFCYPSAFEVDGTVRLLDLDCFCVNAMYITSYSVGTVVRFLICYMPRSGTRDM